MIGNINLKAYVTLPHWGQLTEFPSSANIPILPHSLGHSFLVAGLLGLLN